MNIIENNIIRSTGRITYPCVNFTGNVHEIVSRVLALSGNVSIGKCPKSFPGDVSIKDSWGSRSGGSSCPVSSSLLR